MKVKIAGKPYNLTRNSFGYGVVPLAKRTDRFWKSYQVWTKPDGEPIRCDCPDCYHRGNWCKHIRAIEQIYRAENPEVFECLREEAIAASFELS